MIGKNYLMINYFLIIKKSSITLLVFFSQCGENGQNKHCLRTKCNEIAVKAKL